LFPAFCFPLPTRRLNRRSEAVFARLGPGPHGPVSDTFVLRCALIPSLSHFIRGVVDSMALLFSELPPAPPCISFINRPSPSPVPNILGTAAVDSFLFHLLLPPKRFSVPAPIFLQCSLASYCLVVLVFVRMSLPLAVSSQRVADRVFCSEILVVFSLRATWFFQGRVNSPSALPGCGGHSPPIPRRSIFSRRKSVRPLNKRVLPFSLVRHDSSSGTRKS